MKVSVVITTYKHEKFISKCLESVLSQRTNFPYEILVGVEELDLKTTEICKAFERANSDKITIHVNPRDNIHYANGKRVGRANWINVLSNANGEFVARCDGDDFWTNPLKLQRQVDFLDSNKDYAVVGTNYAIVNEHGDITNSNFYKDQEDFDITHLMFLRKYYLHTATSLFRRCAIEDVEILRNDKITAGDVFMFSLISLKGKGRFLCDVCSAYRITESGVYSGLSTVQQEKVLLIDGPEFLRVFSSSDEQKVIRSKMNNSYKRLLKHLLRSINLKGFLKWGFKYFRFRLISLYKAI